MKKRKYRPLLVAAVCFFLFLIFKKYLMSYPDRIKSVLRKKKAFPEKLIPVIIAQAMHESGNFKSNLFLTNNNAFGMGIPVERKSPYIIGAGIKRPASEGGAAYAKFISLEDSVRDLLHWHDFKGTDWSKIVSVQGYASYLKSKGYYADTVSNYTKGMLHYYAQLNLIMPEITTV